MSRSFILVIFIELSKSQIIKTILVSPMLKPVTLMPFDTGRSYYSFVPPSFVVDTGTELPADQQSYQNLSVKVNKNEVIEL